MSKNLLMMMKYDVGVDNIWNLYDSMIPSAEADIKSSEMVSINNINGFSGYIKSEKERGNKICEAVRIF